MVNERVATVLPPPTLPEKSVFRRQLPQELVAFASLDEEAMSEGQLSRKEFSRISFLRLLGLGDAQP